MAVKITEMTEITVPTLEDYVPIVYTTSGKTSKIKLKYLIGVAQDESDVADEDLVVM